MRTDLLLHTKTSRQIDGLLKKPPHALIIIAPAGAGKKTIAEYIAARLLNVSIDKLQSQPFYIELVKPNGKTEIPIESVRELIKGLRLKTGSRRRVVLIDEAYNLSEEAQNALLKAIEEPPAGTLFMLTSPTAAGVLPTIASRSQKLNIFPASKSDSRSFFQDFEELQVDSAWRLSRGAAGLMTAILRDSEDHAIKKAVDQAKEFLGMDRFKRVIFLDKLAADKQEMAAFIDALERVYAALSDASAARQQKTQVLKLTKARRRLSGALVSLDQNVSARLVALDLALSL